VKRAFDILVSKEYIKKKKIFVVKCINLDISSQGKTPDEGIKNIKDVINITSID